MVQCSRCANQFNALDYLSETPPATPSADSGEQTTTSAARSTGQTARATPSGPTKAGGTASNDNVIELDDDDVEIIPISKDPSSNGPTSKGQGNSTERTEQSGRPRIVAERNVEANSGSRIARLIAWLMWLALSAAAVAALAVQTVYWMPEQNINGWGFLRGHVCNTLDCPAHQYDLRKIEIIGRESMTIKPEEEHTIINSGRIINNAEFAQPFPTLRVTLRDAKDKVLGERDFYAHEYLVDHSDKMLPPATPMQFRIEAVNPLMGDKWDTIHVDTRLHYAPRPQKAATQ